MAWIQLHQSAYTHRKTYRLAKAMGWDPCETVGRLAAMWCWAMDNAPGGIIPEEDSAALLYVMGKPTEERLLLAMIKAGYMEQVPGGYAICNWAEYGGRLEAARQADAQRKRTTRKAKGASSGQAADIQRTGGGQQGDGGKCPADGRRRVEKSREERREIPTRGGAREADGYAPRSEELLGDGYGLGYGFADGEGDDEPPEIGEDDGEPCPTELPDWVGDTGEEGV
jgi:hypothetical protein